LESTKKSRYVMSNSFDWLSETPEQRAAAAQQRAFGQSIGRRVDQQRAAFDTRDFFAMESLRLENAQLKQKTYELEKKLQAPPG